jgi:subfamily B ATP-binding cassette protein HlyB/CyaB
MQSQPGESAADGVGGGNVDSGLACLVMLARFHGISAEPAQLAHEFSEGGGFGLTQILLAAKKLGLKAKLVECEYRRLPTTPLPALATGRDGGFFILAKVEGDQVLIHDPAAARPQTLAREALEARWDGRLMLFASRASLAGQLARFDFSWFIPAMVKYRKLLGEVLLMSFFLQLFALVSPLFFQVVMDKVLVHQGFTTLDVICIGLLVISVFEVLLGGCAPMCLLIPPTASTSNSARACSGICWFAAGLFPSAPGRRFGGARPRTGEHPPSSPAGAMTSVLDLLFSVVFIAVMLFTASG